MISALTHLSPVLATAAVMFAAACAAVGSDS